METNEEFYSFIYYASFRHCGSVPVRTPRHQLADAADVPLPQSPASSVRGSIGDATATQSEDFTAIESPVGGARYRSHRPAHLSLPPTPGSSLRCLLNAPVVIQPNNSTTAEVSNSAETSVVAESPVNIAEPQRIASSTVHRQGGILSPVRTQFNLPSGLLSINPKKVFDSVRNVIHRQRVKNDGYTDLEKQQPTKATSGTSPIWSSSEGNDEDDNTAQLDMRGFPQRSTSLQAISCFPDGGAAVEAAIATVAYPERACGGPLRAASQATITPAAYAERLSRPMESAAGPSNATAIYRGRAHLPPVSPLRSPPGSRALREQNTTEMDGEVWVPAKKLIKRKALPKEWRDNEVELQDLSQEGKVVGRSFL